MTPELMYDRLLGISNSAVTVCLNLLVHSTIIISAGLLLAFTLRNKGATIQSLILRFFFAAALLSPVMSMLLGTIGVKSITISIPSVHTETKLESPFISKTVAEKSSNLSQTESHRFSASDASLQQKATSKTGSKKTPHETNIDSPLKQTTSTYSNEKPVISQPDERKLQTSPEEKTLSNYLPDIEYIYISLTIIWVTLSLILTLHLIWAFLFLWHIKRNASGMKSDWSRQCEIIANELNIEPLPVLESAKVKTPCVAGLFRPAILLPKHKKNMDYLTRDIFLHEYAHVLRHDLFWNFLRQVGTLLLPIQPLMWILSHKIDEASDYACDDFVMSHTANHRDYARNLFSLAQNHLLAKHTLSTSVGILSFKSSLKLRIQRILDRSRRLYLRVSAFFVVFVSFLSVFATFVSGLVGIRGKNIDQSRYTAEQYSDIIDTEITIVTPETESSEKEYSGLSVSTVNSQMNDVWGVDKGSLVEEEEDIITNTEPLEYGNDFLPEETYPRTAQPQQHKFPESENKITQINSELTVDKDNVTDNNNQNSETEQETLKPDYDIARSHIIETENVVMMFQDKDASNVSSFAFQNNIGLTGSASISSGEISSLALKTLDIVISYDFENADLTNPEEKLTYDMYRSLENNKLYPVWSPDGSHIVITDDRYGIWMVPVKGGEPDLIFRNDPVRFNDISIRLDGVEPICFSPGGRELTYKRYIIDENMGTKVFIDDNASPLQVTIMNPVPVIETLNLDTGRSQLLAKGAAYGRWSYDGRLFLYTRLDNNSFKELIVRDVSTGIEYPIDEFEAYSIQLSTNDRYFMFSNDDLFLIPGTGELKRFSLSGDVTFSDISIDAHWILYTYNNSLYVYDTHKEEATELFPERGISPSWARFSPDLKDICFSLKTDDNNWDIYLYDFGKITGVTDVAEEMVPQAFELKENYPNPFNASTTIQFSLPERERASMVIYNVMGQRVRELISGELEPGMHSIVWDSRDDSGRSVGTGIYMARLATGNHKAVIRMSFVK